MLGDTKVQKNYENKKCEQSVRTLAFAVYPSEILGLVLLSYKCGNDFTKLYPK